MDDNWESFTATVPTGQTPNPCLTYRKHLLRAVAYPLHANNSAVNPCPIVALPAIEGRGYRVKRVRIFLLDMTTNGV